MRAFRRSFRRLFGRLQTPSDDLSTHTPHTPRASEGADAASEDGSAYTRHDDVKTKEASPFQWLAKRKRRPQGIEWDERARHAELVGAV